MSARLTNDGVYVVSKDGWTMNELQRKLKLKLQLTTPLMELPECYEKLGLRFDDEDLFKQKLEDIGKPLSHILERNIIDHFHFKQASDSQISLLPSFDTDVKLKHHSVNSLFDIHYNKLPTYEVFVNSEHADPEIKRKWQLHYPAYLKNFKTLKIQEKKMHQLIRQGLNRYFQKECSEPMLECYEKLGLRFDDEDLFKQKLEKIGKPLSYILEGNLIDHFYFKQNPNSQIPLLPSFDTDVKLEHHKVYSLFDGFYDELPTYEVFVDSEHADPDIKRKWQLHYPEYRKDLKLVEIQEKRLHKLIKEGLYRFIEKECSEPKIKDQIHSITGRKENIELLRHFLEMVQDGQFKDSGLPPNRQMETLLHDIENSIAPQINDNE